LYKTSYFFSLGGRENLARPLRSEGMFRQKIMSGNQEPGGTGTSGGAENKTQGNEESSQ
jgi:hypothetical protein